MSQETSTWLNTMTLIGFTEKRGHAWHYRESEQGAEPNHYPLAIPTGDIKRRLFDWEPVVGTSESAWADADGVTHHSVWDKRQTIIHPDYGTRLGEFTDGFKIHGYTQWLITNTENLLDVNGLGAGSAGLLKGGAVAWVQAEMPESIETPEGVTGRPFITAATSLDGSLSSTYMTGTQLVVCDNTLSAALSEKTNRIKIKHSRNSIGRLGEVRDALGIIYQTADDFAAEVKELCEIKVTDADWAKFLDAHCGELPADKGRARTNNENHRERLASLYRNDLRVAPWAGTAFGVVQAVNTFEHHVKTVKGAERAERNMTKMVTGEFDKLDQSTMAQLRQALVQAA